MNPDQHTDPPDQQPEFAEVLRVLRASRDTPPPNLAPRVMARIRARRRMPLAIAAALLALLGASVVLLHNRPAPELSEESASDPFHAPEITTIEVALTLTPPVEQTDAHLRRARGWLVRHQDLDGGWTMGRTGASANYVVGTSALALLALISDTSDQSDAIDSIKRGLDFLARQQDAQGLFGPAITGSLYNHALACLALIRARDAVTPTPRADSALHRGLELLVHSQRPEGGWTYLRSRGAPNSSLTVWAIQVLMEATDRGIADFAVEVERGLVWLEQTVDENGRAGYRRGGDHPYGSETLTAAAALCFLERGSGRDPRLARMIENIRRDVGNAAPSLDLYRAFFQAAALRADPEPDEELPLLAARLRAAQDLDGEDAGSWPPLDRWSAAGGRVYSTALALLALSGR